MSSEKAFMVRKLRDLKKINYSLLNGEFLITLTRAVFNRVKSIDLQNGCNQKKEAR